MNAILKPSAHDKVGTAEAGQPFFRPEIVREPLGGGAEQPELALEEVTAAECAG